MLSAYCHLIQKVRNRPINVIAAVWSKSNKLSPALRSPSKRVNLRRRQMKRAINLLVVAVLFLGSYSTPTCVTPKSIERSRPTSREPAAQSPDYWPTKEWRSSTPEQQGVDSAQLADALTAIKQHDIRIHSLLLVR